MDHTAKAPIGIRPHGETGDVGSAKPSTATTNETVCRIRSPSIDVTNSRNMTRPRYPASEAITVGDRNGPSSRTILAWRYFLSAEPQVFGAG